MTTTSGAVIYKLVGAEEWALAEIAGRFEGSAVDRRDGFIHFSTADQLLETARLHFTGAPDLLCVAVDSQRLGEHLRWEPSRGGALFPHLYGPLRMADVIGAAPAPLDADAVPRVPRP